MDFDILCEKSNFVANLEDVGMLFATFVGFLHFLFAETKGRFGFLTDLLETIEAFVHCRDVRTGTSWDCEVWSVAVNNLEWCLLIPSVKTGVEGELSGGEMIGPIRLSLVDEQSEILFDFLVLSFDLTVTFGVISGGESDDDTEAFEQGGHESGSKLGSSVGEDLFRKSVKAEYFAVVQVGCAFRCQIGLAEGEVCLSREVIDIGCNSIVAVRRGKLGDEIDANMLPRASRGFLRR